MTKPDQVKTFVEEAANRLGGLDVVVNSAGVAMPVRLEDLDAAEWRRVLDSNLSGTFYVARAAGLLMRVAGSGTIVNIGSELSFMGMPMYAAYCASKAGVIGLTKALAAELAPEVTVNAICPGPVDTPMLDGEFAVSGDAAKALDETITRVPLHRLATAHEVALGILYLATDASYATGTALGLDGGSTIV